MSGHLTTNTAHLIRSELWSNQIKDILLDELYAQKYIKWISEFPDGDLLHIPTIGMLEAQDYVENQPVEYTALDTGDFTFQITEYKQSGTYISNKFKQDSYYQAQLQAEFVPAMARAIATQMEVDALRVGPQGQTPNDPNKIEGVSHRFIGTGSGNSITVEDFARAYAALQKANVPLNNLVAIVDPSVAYSLGTQTNLVNFMSPVPQWNNIVSTGGLTGMKFRMNVYGFDVYVSSYLHKSASETIHGQVSGNDVVNNLFFSAEASVLPFIGAIRQAPNVDSEYNKDLQREEYVTTCRYGMKLFRPENLVTILTNSTIADPSYS